MSQHERRVDAHEAIAEPTQLLIPTAVSRAATAMHAAVHLEAMLTLPRKLVVGVWSTDGTRCLGEKSSYVAS